MRRRNEDQKMVISWLIMEDMTRRDWESGLFAAMDLGFKVIFVGRRRRGNSPVLVTETTRLRAETVGQTDVVKALSISSI